MCRPIGVKFCMVVRTIPSFYNARPKFLGAHPKKILGAKNVQNLAQFQTTLKFSSEYLWNG